MDNLLSALYSLPGGILADRIGTKWSLLVFNLIAMAGLCACHFGTHLTGRVDRGRPLYLLVGHLPTGQHELDLQGAAPKQAHHGGQHALPVAPHSHVTRTAGGGLFISVWGKRTGVRLAFGGACSMAALALWMQQRWGSGCSVRT
jgi:hypothetical protein